MHSQLRMFVHKTMISGEQVETHRIVGDESESVQTGVAAAGTNPLQKLRVPNP